MKNLGLLLVLTLAVAACTKEKSYEFAADPNNKVIDKNLFSKEDFGNLKPEEIAKLSPEEKRKFRTPRIAVMSYGQATRTASASMPYFQGRTKLVEFEIGEDNIEVRELEKDPRFVDNPLNSKTIMVMPVRHIDYECEKDAYGECQNKEVENKNLPWEDRRYIEVDFKNSKILDVDELPVEITNLLSGCYVEGVQKPIDLELTKDVFNFELQKSYSINLTNPSCWGEISDFEDLFEKLNFDVRYVYSMVRADQIASADYKKVLYKKADEGTFGFFETKINKLDVDNNPIENNDEVLLNRWNPDRKVIPYFLSDEFNKPEHGYVLEATRTAVANINAGLAQAGTGLQIELKAPAGKKVGDLRHNMIVLVDDPLASRIIGYGPSAAHPLTGEIVNARTVMYLGTIRGIVKKTYEDMREELLAQKENAEEIADGNSIEDVVENVKSSLKVITNGEELFRNQFSLKERRSVFQNSVSAMNLSSKSNVLKSRSLQMKSFGHGNISDARVAHIKNEIMKFQKLEGASLLAKSSKFIDKRIDILSKHNVYPEELFNAEYALKSAGIDGKIESSLKPWDKLTSSEKEEIIRLVLPHIWIPTLVHELGHNLGLRHNFAGSEDKANFYTQEELGKMGIKREIPYSSMMEYSYKTTNELPTLGKYDVAALKFAYKREVDVVDQNGQFVKAVNVESSLADTNKILASEGLALKAYRYCTDEHASANPTCNRFDEGTNLVEIATHFITSYEKNYNRVNKRNGRKNFSLFQEGAYLGRVSGNFYDLRLIFELYERIKNDFGVEDGSELWTQVDFLKEIYEASTLAGQFFAGILLTPDVNCAIALAQEPRAPVALFPLIALDANATTCFHPDVDATIARLGEANNLKLVIAGEGGKSFKSRKDSLNENAYADQIDVQGIWVDKMLAMEFLFSRELGSNLFDKTTENFLNHPTVGPSLEGVLAAILLGRGAIEVPFRNAEGSPVEFMVGGGETTNVLPLSIEFGKEHFIDVPLISGLTNYFGLPERQTTFSREIVRSLNRLVPTLIGAVEADRFMDTFSVFREWPGEGLKFVNVQVGTKIYFALAENKVAASAIQGIGLAKIFNGISAADVEKVLAMKQKGEKLPDTASDQIKAVYALENDVLQAYVDGLIKTVPFYEELLGSLVVSQR